MENNIAPDLEYIIREMGMESPADRLEAVFPIVSSEFRPNLRVPVAKLDEVHRVLPRRHTTASLCQPQLGNAALFIYVIW